ncbi:MAG: GntR family transcriptional regulator [Nevskia sp.]|nr:GntR family transcriptional regulator [Nevskia sp.]
MPAHKNGVRVHRTCMRDHVRNAIVSRILDGTTPPGTRLKELALAREFNVSQAPVREALRELEALGLLESERYRGTRVRNIDLIELREAYELRAVIEEAAARRAVPCAKADLDRLESDLKLMRRAIREKDSDALMDNAVNFHRHIVQMSGNSLYLRAWERMAWDVRARIAVQRIGLIRGFAEQRKAVITALREGDGVRAGQLLRGMVEELLAHLDRLRHGEAMTPGWSALEVGEYAG